jgi:putative DNA primase/helicase
MAAAVERFAQADRAFAVTSEIWDQDHFLLGTPGGTVDLRTGDVYEARPEDFITKLAAVAPSKTADCPLWFKFLHETTNDDRDLIAFLQQYCGYMPTGDIREHALLFVYGPGGNGKSVLLSTVSGILGEYCRTAPMETFTASKSDRHPTELAMLRGARMVCASETEEGRAWAESKIKQITGGDVISARFMRQDFFEFKPQFKLVVIGNHKPNLRNVDDAMRRRFNIVPFLYKPPNPDKKLEDKLRDEWPGILRWAIDGCLAWQRSGLVRAEVVLDATAEYFSEQDTFRQWIEDCCETGSRALSETTGTLFYSWTQYALGSRACLRPALPERHGQRARNWIRQPS